MENEASECIIVFNLIIKIGWQTFNLTLRSGNAVESIVYTVKDIQKKLNLSRSATYELIKSPPFPVMRFGKTYRISKEVFDNWFKQLNQP